MDTVRLKILLAASHEEHAERLRLALEGRALPDEPSGAAHLEMVAGFDAAQAALAEGVFDALLLEAGMLEPQAADKLERLLAAADGTPLLSLHEGQEGDLAVRTYPQGRLLHQSLTETGVDLAAVLNEAAPHRKTEQASGTHPDLQAAVAELGQLALGGLELDALLELAVGQVARHLKVEFAKVLELLPGEDSLRLRAGVGWTPGLVGSACVETEGDSQAGFTLASAGPVIVSELEHETRFRGPELLLDHQIVSGVSVVIDGPQGAYGVLGAHSARRRSFTEDEVHFLQSVANLLGAAVERHRAEESLRHSENRYRQLMEQASDGIFINSAQGALLQVNDRACEMLGFDRQELLRRNIQDLIPDEDREASALLIRRLEADEHVITERIMLHKEGNLLPVEISARRLPDGNLMAVVRDISERKRTEAVLRRKLHEASVLREVAAAGAEATSQRAFLEKVTEILQNHLYRHNFGVLLLDESQNLLVIGESYRFVNGIERQGQIPVGQGISGRVVRTGEPSRVPDISVDPDYLRLDPAVRSELCVPLKIGERVIGVINVESTRLDDFSEEDERLLCTLADQVATGIEKVRLFEAEREQRTLAETLQRVGMALNSTLELPDLLNLICKEALAVFKVQAAYVWLLQGDHLVGFAGDGKGVDNFIGRRVALMDEVTLGARVVREKRAAIVNQAPKSQGVNQELVAMFQVHGVLGVPLLTGERAIGALMIIETEGRRSFQPKDLDTANALGSQAAIAIANAQLFDQERRRREEAETIRQAAMGMTSTLALAEVLDRTLIHLEKVVPFDSACVYLVDDERLVAMAGRNHPLGEGVIGREYPLLGNPVLTEIRINRRPLICADVQQVDSFKHWEGTQEVRGWMGVPLIARGAVIGYVTLDSHSPDAYDENQAVLAQALANQAAMAIDNARLFEASQRQSRELVGLYDTALATSSVLVIEALLARLRDQIKQLHAPEGFGVFFYEEGSEELVVAAAYEEDKDLRDIIGETIPLSAAGLTGWVVGSRRPLLVEDLQTDSLPVEPRHITTPARSWLGVPLIARDRLIGVITLQSFRPRAFNSADRRFLESMAAQVAVAIENARLYEAAQQGVVRREALNAIVAAAAGAMDLDELLSTVLDRTLRALNLKSGAIWVREKYVMRNISPRLRSEVMRLAGEATIGLFEITEIVEIEDWQQLAPGAPLAPLVPHITSSGIRATLLVGVLSAGRPIGGLALVSRKVRRWSQEEVALVGAIGSQVGAAVDRLRQFARAQAHSELMEKLVPVSEALNRTLTVGEVYREIGFGAMSLAGVDKVAVYVRHPNDSVSCPWSHGISQEYIQSVLAKVDEVPGGRLLTRAQTIQIEDIQALPEGHVLKPLAHQQAYRALALWPLIFEDKVIAAVGCYYPRPHAWSDTEQEVMDAFARQAAVALENARLFEAQHRRSAELEALRQASLRLTSSLELQPVLEDILDQALRLISADDAHIFLYDGDRLHFGTAMWAGDRQQKPFSEPRRNGVTYTVAHSGERVVAPDVNQHPLFDGYQWGGAIVSLPLVKSGKVRGVMNVAFDKPYDFAEEELRVLELLADQAGIAIENARLFQALEARVAELSVIADASAALREAASVQEIGQMIANQTSKLVQADAALLSLVDDSGRWLVPIGMVGLPSEIMECEHSVAEGFSRQVLRTRKAFHSDDLENEPLAVTCKEMLAGLGPALCVPLRTSAEQVVGTLLAARSKQAKAQPPLYESQAERLLYTLAEIAGNALQRAHAFEALEVAYLETVLSLAKAMDARDSYTSDHSQRLAVWAEDIALEIGCQDDEIQSILWAALLHDIGKIGVPDHILRKPGPLTDEEWAVMKLHPVAGAEIVSPVKSLEDVAPLIRAHQERFDGQGYPDGLSGEDIPLGARILAVVDAYSAITDDRVYRKARTHEEALDELRRCAGTQFDPQVVEVFVRVIEQRRTPQVAVEPPARRAIRAHATGSLKMKGGRHPDSKV